MNKKIIPFLPIGSILLGLLIALCLTPFMKGWTFIPLAFVYWGSTFTVSLKVLGREKMKELLQRPIGSRGWSILAIIPALIPLSIMLMNFHLIGANKETLFWIIFAIINPFFEEIFWRGLLLTKLSWKTSLSIIYSTVLFVASHPLTWGVFSIANRSWMTWVSLAIMGFIWSIIFLKTKSLRYCIISHFFVDLFNISVFVFLNLYIPPIM